MALSGLFDNTNFRLQALGIPPEMDRMRASHQSIPSLIIKHQHWYLIPYLTEDELNYADEHGKTLLMHVIRARQIFFAQYLCRTSLVLINTWDYFGLTPLHYASVTGDLNIIQTLVAAGADINANCVHGYTIAHHAAIYGHMPLLQYLVEAGVNLDRSDNYMGIPPIANAVDRGQLEVVQFLIPYHSPDFRDQTGCNLATLALDVKNFKIYEYLVSIGHEPCYINYKVAPLTRNSIMMDPGLMVCLLDRYGNPLIDPIVDRACGCKSPIHTYQPGTCPTLLDHVFMKNPDCAQLLLSRGIGYTYT